MSFEKDTTFCEVWTRDGGMFLMIPDNIKQIILSAIDAEIKKLDEE